MAGAQGGGMLREKTRTRNPMVEEILPSSAWTEDPEVHRLLVDLPGFKKEEVKLQIDDSGNISVSGEKLVKDSKFIIFEKTYKIPKNADADQISGEFDGAILYVTIPKQPTKKPEEPPSTISGKAVEEENVESKNAHKDDKKGEEKHDQHEQKKEKEAEKFDNNRKDGFPKEVVEKWGSQDASALLKCAMETLKKHKGIVITAAFASLAFLVGRKF